jgi:cell wall-associated NlpC family hydrolase
VKTAISACALLLLLPVLFLAAATGILGGGTGTSFGQTSSPQVARIPPEYLQLFLAAGARYDVPWPVLAGIGKIECDDGQDPDPSCTREGAVNSAGAAGPMQFLAPTWAGYAVDGNGDGRTDRWNPADAVFTAARYLHANGAPRELERAIYAYNHSTAYVALVMRWAHRYEQEATSTAPVAGGPGAGALAFALSQIGVPYVWGGESPAGYDCSGLTQAAYSTIGIDIPRTSEEQWAKEPHVPAGASLQPGDLVFFGPDPQDATHVGIVLRPGKMVDAPHTGTNVRTEAFPTTIGASWGEDKYLGAARPAG